MRDNGRTTRPRAKGSSLTPTVTSMRASGPTTRPMGLEYTSTAKLELGMRDTGRTICSTAREWSSIVTGINIRGCSRTERGMGRVPTTTLQVRSIREDG